MNKIIKTFIAHLSLKFQEGSPNTFNLSELTFFCITLRTTMPRFMIWFSDKIHMFKYLHFQMNRKPSPALLNLECFMILKICLHLGVYWIMGLLPGEKGGPRAGTKTGKEISVIGKSKPTYSRIPVRRGLT